jgi:hypothetical protein
MRNEMHRGRSQVLWRYMPGALFRYNESGGWSSTTQVPLKDTESLGGALRYAIKGALNRWKAIGPAGYPDPEQQPQKYVVGEPLHVLYEAWPLVFSCRQCGRVHYYKDIASLRSSNDRLSCFKCRGNDQLKQIPYGYVCECGRLDTIFVPRCPRNQAHSVELVNKGSFQESFWRCQECHVPLRRNTREGLGYRRCECSPKKGKRGIPLEDSRAFYSQSLSLVEVKPALLDKWHGNSRFSDLLLAAVVQSGVYKLGDLSSLAAWKPSADALSPELLATLDILIKSGMAPSQAEAIVRQGAKAGGADPWLLYDDALALVRPLSGDHDWAQVQRTVEYVFVRDDSSVGAVPLGQLAAEAHASAQNETVARLNTELEMSHQLGFSKLAVVRALPVLLAAYGYSRYFGSPRDATDDAGASGNAISLRPFPLEGGKLPIYVARNTTEALLYELDPWRLAAFLAVNGKAVIPPTALQTESTIRAWLLGIAGPNLFEGEAHLVLDSWEIQEGKSVNLLAALLFGVTHTVAHVLKASAHRHVGIDGDSLAEYLFVGHGAGLIYVSSNVEFTLGGIDSVFRANLTQWLGSARDFAGQCSLDPVCAHAGGACLACLYPKFGCAHFNRTVSRAFLFGGEVPGYDGRLEGYWMPAVRLQADALQDAPQGQLTPT